MRGKRITPPLVPQVRGRAPPLSYAQEGLWILDQLGLVGTAYNVPLTLRLYGVLEQDALQWSFSELVRRHESLRTRFGVAEGLPYQLISAPDHFELQLIDLSHIQDQERRERQLHERMQAEQLHTFDLATGPLFRVTVVRLCPTEHAILITMHHIIMDGWSIGVLRRELSSLYTAYVTDQPNPLPELPIQYVDFAIWQRNWLRGDVLQVHSRYWRGRLRGAPTELNLPTDRRRPSVATCRGAELAFVLSETLCEEMSRLARSRGATSFMLILATFQLLLSRYSGQQDVLVGFPIAGRTHRSTEGLVGFFVNTLVLRTDLSGNPSFIELLSRVREATLRAYEHQDLPFEKLVMDLRPERSLSRQPIFQVMLAIQNYPSDELSLQGLRWSQSTYTSTYLTAKFDLVLHLLQSSEHNGGCDGLRCVFEYSTDLFNRETIKQMSNHFQDLLERVLSYPDVPID